MLQSPSTNHTWGLSEQCINSVAPARILICVCQKHTWFFELIFLLLKQIFAFYLMLNCWGIFLTWFFFLTHPLSFSSLLKMTRYLIQYSLIREELYHTVPCFVKFLKKAINMNGVSLLSVRAWHRNFLSFLPPFL